MQKQGFEQLTLFPEDFLASHSPQPGSAVARTMTVTSGRKCCELYRKSGPLGSLVRTLLVSSAWRSTRCYLTWKASATPARRLLFRLVPSIPHTEETGSQFWVGTPTGAMGKRIDKFAKLIPTPTTGAGMCGGSAHYRRLEEMEDAGVISQEERRSMAAGNGGQLNPTWVEWLMGFPLGWTDLSA